MVITVAMQKGGTGKSTTAAALTQAAADAGKRALAIDLDSQGNTSFFLSADTTRPGAYELLTGTADPRRYIQTTQGGLDVIPASWNLATVTGSRGSARRLQRAIEPIKKSYDLIIIDTPPNAGELQYNALQAATALVIPLQAESFSIQGLYLVKDTTDQIKKSNPALEKTGIVITRYLSRSNIDKLQHQNTIEAAQQMGFDYFGTIREGKDIREAQALRANLFTAAPKSKPALDYMEVYKT